MNNKTHELKKTIALEAAWEANHENAHIYYENGFRHGFSSGYDHAAAELRWIPIRSADDLPKENGYYLATCGSVGIDPDDTTSHELNWFGGKWYLPSDEMIEMDGVIAWMKKPKPYTEPADSGEREDV